MAKCCIKPSVKAWLEKAEEDLVVALREHRARSRPTHNAVCFHAQQCIEKHLKAILEQDGERVPKTHALPALLDACLPLHPLLEALRSELVRLSFYAVEFRYPGESADREQARAAVLGMKQCRRELRHELGLPDR